MQSSYYLEYEIPSFFNVIASTLLIVMIFCFYKDPTWLPHSIHWVWCLLSSSPGGWDPAIDHNEHIIIWIEWIPNVHAWHHIEEVFFRNLEHDSWIQIFVGWLEWARVSSPLLFPAYAPDHSSNEIPLPSQTIEIYLLKIQYLGNSIFFLSFSIFWVYLALLLSCLQLEIMLYYICRDGQSTLSVLPRMDYRSVKLRMVVLFVVVVIEFDLFLLIICLL